jgi:predicted transcriptional regulator
VFGSVKSNLDLILLRVFNLQSVDWLGMALDTLGVTARRDKITIMGDLLGIIQEPRRVTHILYKSNMSYVQLLKYLENLKNLGLAQENKKPFRSFMITNNGKKFMELITRNGKSESHSE